MWSPPFVFTIVVPRQTRALISDVWAVNLNISEQLYTEKWQPGCANDWWLQPQAVCGHALSCVIWGMPQKQNQFIFAAIAWLFRDGSIRMYQCLYTFTFYLWCRWQRNWWVKHRFRCSTKLKVSSKTKWEIGVRKRGVKNNNSIEGRHKMFFVRNSRGMRICSNWCRCGRRWNCGRGMSHLYSGKIPQGRAICSRQNWDNSPYIAVYKLRIIWCKRIPKKFISMKTTRWSSISERKAHYFVRVEY